MLLFEEMYKLIIPKLLNYCRFNLFLSKQDAEDLCQNVFSKVIKKQVSKGYTIEQIISYFKRALRWEASNFKIKQRETYQLYNILRERNITICNYDIIYNILRDIPKKYSKILYIHYIEGLSINEISKLEKISSSNVSIRLYRARQFIKKKFKINEKS